MAYVIDEDYSQLPPPPTRAEVEADLVDWKLRLTDLMALLNQWAKEIPGIDTVVVETEKLERKMELVGIHEPVQLPLLLIDRQPDQPIPPATGQISDWPLGDVDHGFLSVWPDARWVIGTRGQVWLQSADYKDTLVDIGRPGKPDWRYTQQGEYLRPLSKDSFQTIVKSLR